MMTAEAQQRKGRAAERGTPGNREIRGDNKRITEMLLKELEGRTQMAWQEEETELGTMQEASESVKCMMAKSAQI